MMQQADLENALHRVQEQFTVQPEWLVLATTAGLYLAHVASPNMITELDRIVALAAAAAGHHERRAMEYGLGRLQYGLTFAERGFVIAAFVSEDWVLSLKFNTASTAVLSDILQALPDACRPLRDLWENATRF
jgi:hypothetical protein